MEKLQVNQYPSVFHILYPRLRYCPTYWTPADLGYQITTPSRGRFVARNISASGSVVFIINDYGDMYTKHVDFDVIGADPNLRYTYEIIPVHEGILDQKYPRKLPIADWKRQLKIDGVISDVITVYTTDTGENARNLRVAGQDLQVNLGYYEKNLTASGWKFIKTPVSIDSGTLLRNTPEGIDPPIQGTNRELLFNYISILFLLFVCIFRTVPAQKGLPLNCKE